MFTWRSCGPVLLVSLHSRCHDGLGLPLRPRLLRPLAVLCCAHHGGMEYVHQLHGIEERWRVSAEQVWIAQRQMFDGCAGFEVCAARVLAHPFQMSLADGCTCATHIGRRIFRSQRAHVQHAAAQWFSGGFRVVSMLAAVDAHVQEPHVARSSPRARPAARFCGLREVLWGF